MYLQNLVPYEKLIDIYKVFWKKVMINRIKGTQDFLDLTLFNFLIEKARKHLSIYNFSEISTPILEPLELYVRSLGLETDVISKEMYIVKTTGDEESICLRPEGTAATVRAFIDNKITQIPWKVFSWGPMFRHERPQKGRYRQFHQINIEVIGSKEIDQDVLFIKMLDRFFFESLHLDNFALHINFLGCLSDRTAYKKILYKYLESVIDIICQQCKIRKEKNIMRVFDCKNPACQELYKSAPHIIQYLCSSCQSEWQELKENLEHLSVSYSIRPTLVRGLDYYGKTVFEFVSPELGAQDAFCGGGRYDQLVKELGAKEDHPSMGAAIGIERLLILLDKKKDLLSLPTSLPLYLILPLGHEYYSLALLIADELHANNFCTDIVFEGESLKSMMRKANKLGAKFVILIGKEEQEKKLVTIKDMTTGKEKKILQRDLVSYLK